MHHNSTMHAKAPPHQTPPSWIASLANSPLSICMCNSKDSLFASQGIPATGLAGYEKMILPYLLTPNNVYFKLRVIIISCECSIFKMNPWNLFHFLSLVLFVLADQFIDQNHQALWITSIPILKRLRKIGTKVFRNNVPASNTGLKKSAVWPSRTS